MKSLLQQDKKGVSIMIGYVLLIVIAIGLSVAVFAYLKLYLPKDEPKCRDDVILSIDRVSCIGIGGGNFEVSINLTNRGFFSINGAFLRIGEVDRIFKTLLGDGEVYFLEGNNPVLKPGDSWNPEDPYSYTPDNPNEPQELEVEPFLFIGNKPVLCEKAVVSKIISCT